MQPLLDVVKVKTCPGYRLELEFENGECREFDMTAYMERKPFIRLKDPHLFNLAHVEYGTVVWPGNIDISPETLYDRSRSLEMLAQHEKARHLAELGGTEPLLEEIPRRGESRG